MAGSIQKSDTLSRRGVSDLVKKDTSESMSKNMPRIGMLQAVSRTSSHSTSSKASWGSFLFIVLQIRVPVKVAVFDEEFGPTCVHKSKRFSTCGMIMRLYPCYYPWNVLRASASDCWSGERSRLQFAPTALPANRTRQAPTK